MARILKEGARGPCYEVAAEVASMMTEDFTKVALGSRVSDSRTIVLCPLCGRAGALEPRRDGSRRCVHVEASMIDRDGLWVDARDVCEWTDAKRVSQAG